MVTENATVDILRELNFPEGKSRNTKINISKTKTYNNAILYRGMTYNKDINKNTKRTELKYKNKIGFNLRENIKEMLERRNETLLMIANAGGGKTYSILDISNELVEFDEEKKTAYVLTVPTTSQSNQNQVGEDLISFGFKSIVGKNSKLKDEDDKRSLTELIKDGYRKFSCVYDTTEKVVEELKAQGLEVVLIIDEAHKLIWDTYREEALEGVERTLYANADMVLMMTATPRTCLKYYEYNEIFELKDEDLKNNIKEFQVRFSDNWELTLRKYIRYNKKKGKISLVRLNNKELIKSLKKSLEKQGYIVEVMTSQNKDSFTFKTIETMGMISCDVDVVFCTSVLECGISLKDPDVIPIEIIRSYKDFNTDDSIQFFARPRAQVLNGVMIIKNYQENLKEVIKNLKEKRTKNKDKQIHASVKALCNFEKYMRDISQEINEDYIYLSTSLHKAMDSRGRIYTREFVKNELKMRDRHKCIEFDEESIKLYINSKKVIQRAYKMMDELIITSSPLLLETFFKDSIFYGKVDVDVDTEDDILEEDIEGMKDAKKERELSAEEIKAKEEEYRSWFLDKNFLDAIEAIVSGNINRANINSYNLNMSIRDIIEFKSTPLYELMVECLKYFSLEETASILTAKYEKSGKYLEKSKARELCERKHTVERIRTVGYKEDCDNKYDTICEIIQHYKGDKNKQITFTKELKIIIHCELVRKKGIKNYKHKETLKVLNDIDPYQLDFDFRTFYTKENIKKLESAISSSNKNNKRCKILKSIDNKITDEVGKIYNLSTKGESEEYIVINKPHKSFNLNNVLKNIIS